MGKKKRVKALAAENAELEISKGSGKKYSAKKEGAWKKPVAIICAILAVVIIIGAFVWYYIPTSGIIQKNKAVMKSDNYKITAAMAEYLFNNAYQNYAQSYSQYLSMFGLDVTKDLKTQDFPQADGTINTWYDYFMDSAFSQLQQSVVLCEAAKADKDFTIDEKAIAEMVDANIAGMKDYAKQNNVSFDFYLSRIYGPHVTESIIKQILTMSEIATEYSDEIDSRNEFAEADWDKYFDENKDSFVKVDYIKYEFKADKVELADDATEEEKAAAEIKDAEALTKAKEAADAAKALKTADEFNAYIENYIRTVVYADLTDEELAEDGKDIAAEVEACTSEGNRNSAESDLNKWLFDSARKSCETYVEEGDASYTVYMILPHEGSDMEGCTYRDTYNLRSYNYIKFLASDFTDLDEAKGVAEEVYGAFKEDATAENFETLAAKEGAEYTASEASSADHGVVCDAVDEWVFDDARKEGDYTLVNDDDGYYLVYYVSTDKIAWQNSADSQLRQEAYQTKLDELTEQYKCENLATPADIKGLISIVDLSALAQQEDASAQG